MRIFKKIKPQNFLIAILGVIASVIFLFISRTPGDFANREKITLEIDGKNYTLITAKTVFEKTIGLSNIEKLEGADGMIFYFDPPQKAIFWNKKTFLDLGLIWMKNGEIIGRDFLPAENKGGLVVKSAPQEVDSVVELVK
jgi:uncharacterized membrane protein (UPF0127 family)